MSVEEQEKQDLRKKKQQVALLFVLALVLTLVFAYWMGALGMGPSKSVVVTYNFAGGIERGSTVRLAGIRVGRVSDISFAKKDSENPGESLQLKIELSRDAFHQITDDSLFYINLAGLIGERYVEIVPGKGAPIKSGAQFRGVDPPRVDQLLSQGYGIFGDLRDFFSENKGDLKEIFATLNDLSKNIAKILDGVSPNERTHLRNLVKNLSLMSDDLRLVAASAKDFSSFMESSNARQTFTEFQSLMSKANKVDRDDIRRLLLEDGIKVNFGTRRVGEVTK